MSSEIEFPRSELDFRRLTVANRQQPPGNRSPRRGLRRHFLLARPDEIRVLAPGLWVRH